MSFRSRRASWTGSRLRELVVRLRRLHGINHIGGLRRCCLHTLDDLAEDARGCHVGWWIWWYERWVCIIRLVVQSKVAPALRQLGRLSVSPQSALARFHLLHSPNPATLPLFIHIGPMRIESITFAEPTLSSHQTYSYYCMCYHTRTHPPKPPSRL